jgi:hypothetical protein
MKHSSTYSYSRNYTGVSGQLHDLAVIPRYPPNGSPGGPLSQPRYPSEDKKYLHLTGIELLLRGILSRSLINVLLTVHHRTCVSV